MSDYVESGLAIPVPVLHEFVIEWRPRVDRIPPVGVPAHITVLYPFIPPGEVESESEIDDLRRFFSEWSSFPYSLTEIGWFGDEVVYARPDRRNRSQPSPTPSTNGGVCLPTAE